MRSTAVLVALLLASSVAHARPLKPEAQVRLDAGLREYNAARYDRAIKEFEAAYTIDPDPDLLLAWAQAERLARRCSAAAPRYRRYLDSRPGVDGEQLAKSGLELCAEATKVTPEPAGCTVTGETRLPWYKSPVGGAIVVGIAGLAVGTGFLVAASGNRTLSETALTSDRFEALLDRATTQRRLGAVFLAFGAALIGGGVGYHLMTRGPAPTTVVSTDGRSIFVARTF
jgi:tetratricopeptide (TPR) repeat protein